MASPLEGAKRFPGFPGVCRVVRSRQFRGLIGELWCPKNMALSTCRFTLIARTESSKLIIRTFQLGFCGSGISTTPLGFSAQPLASIICRFGGSGACGGRTPQSRRLGRAGSQPSGPAAPLESLESGPGARCISGNAMALVASRGDAKMELLNML